MDIKRFEELENKIEERSYSKAYNGKAKLWFFAGIFFQVVNIGVCFLGLYWFLGKLFPVFPGNNFLFALISIMLLCFWESLKRSTVMELAINLLKTNFTFKNHHFGGIVLSVFLISGSGYMAIRGATEITDTTSNIEITANNNLTIVRDSVDSQYEQRILQLEKQSNTYVTLSTEKGRPMTIREAAQTQQWTDQANQLKKEREAKLIDLEKRVQVSVVRQKKDVYSNTLTFLLITLGIESIILLCIIYGAKFDYNSFHEINGDELFNQHRLHIFLLRTIYQDGRQKEGSECMATNRLEELVRIKRGSTIASTDIRSFYVLMTVYEIIKTRGGKRQFTKSYEKALDLFQKNYL